MRRLQRHGLKMSRTKVIEGPNRGRNQVIEGRVFFTAGQVELAVEFHLAKS